MPIAPQKSVWRWIGGSQEDCPVIEHLHILKIVWQASLQQHSIGKATVTQDGYVWMTAVHAHRGMLTLRKGLTKCGGISNGLLCLWYCHDVNTALGLQLLNY